MFFEKISAQMRIVQKILIFGVNEKLLNFNEKLKTASGRYRVDIVTWSFLPFDVNAILMP